MADDPEAEQRPQPKPPRSSSGRASKSSRRRSPKPVDATPLAEAEAAAEVEAAAEAAAEERAEPVPAPPDEALPSLEAAVHLPFTPGATDARPRLDPAVDAASATWLPLLEDRSPNAWVCPFLRAADEDDERGVPVEAPDATNRCAAMREAVPQSLRQQELVCLTSGHVNCPRYLRGAVVATDLVEPEVRPGPSISPAILVSILLVIVSFAGSAAFVVARGGIEIDAALIASPAPEASATALAVAPTASAAAPSAVASPVPASASVPPAATPSPSAIPSATPSPEPTPTTTPEPTATPTPAPTAEPTTKPTSDRYELLTPCPSKPDCYLYKVRSGDNLFSIAKYFGVSLAAVRRLNPWTATTSLHGGQTLVLPPPTR